MKSRIIKDKSSSRKVNSIKNALWGVSAQFFQLLLSFVCRTIFIRKLGVEILGINGLYSNILTVLSIAELGIGNILLFNLYKPLRDGDTEKVAQLLNYYKKLYNVIALVVTVVGLAVMPFLRFIISSDISISNADVYIYYIIFLSSSIFSYLLCYKQSIINADQRNYIIKISNIVFDFLKSGLQIAFLFIIPNFKVYLIIATACVLIQNLFLSFAVDKLYPQLKQYRKSSLPEKDRSGIKKNLYNTFLYKIGTVILTNTDAILISTIVSTVAVGLYSNYNMIVSAITTIVNILIMALYASVGDVIAENNKEKVFKIFNALQFVFAFLSVFCTLCFATVFNDFITIWVGSEYLFSTTTVLIISFSFFFSTFNSCMWLFRENFGLFKDVRFIMLAAAVLNIGFSILLGYFWGVDGILAATIVAKMLSMYIFEPLILYKKVFKKMPWWHYLRMLFYLALTAGSVALMMFIGKYLPSSLGGVFLKIFINGVYSLILFFLFFKTEPFKQVMSMVKGVLKKIKRGSDDVKKSNIKNEISVLSLTNSGKRFEIKFKCEGDCKKYFSKDIFYCEYDSDIKDVKDDILVIPFVCNILPILWIDNIKLHLDSLDKDFYDSINEFKKGYEKMYPNMKFFDGVIDVENLVKNKQSGDKNLCLFSGGVDAYSTLIDVCNQKTELFTVIGSDIPVGHTEGIKNLKELISIASKNFKAKENYCTTNFRDFLNESNIFEIVKESGDGYWHGFQHGIGLISLTAPLCFAGGFNKVYIASSFSNNEMKYVDHLTCASHPSIDNNIKFCGVYVEHNGLEYDRINKIENICNYIKHNDIKLNVHVCWESISGHNCCKCEKCYRTILAICALGDVDPKELEFDLPENFFKEFKKFIKYKSTKKQEFQILYLKDIQSRINENSLYYDQLKWFKKYNLDKFNKSFARFVYHFPRKAFRKLKRMFKKAK